MKKKERINLFILAFVIIISIIIHHYRRIEYKQSEIIMDTFVEITVKTKNKKADFLIDQAFDLIKKYEDKFSYFCEKGYLYQINHTENDSIEIDNDFFQILSLANELYETTDSLYDISVGYLTEIWNFEEQKIPTDNSINVALKKTGFEKISFNRKYLYNPEHVKITLGSIAKGFILDKIVDFLITNEIEEGIINAGGDIKLFGNKKNISIGIKHPRKNNEIIDIIKMNNCAVVTSGDYERAFEVEGKKYHHILNPKTGFPADKMISITVISPLAMTADAYATALFLLDPQEAIKLANNIQGLEVVLYYKILGEIKSLQTTGMEKYLVQNDK